MINLKENDHLPQYVRDIVDFYTNQQNELKSLQEETNQIGFDCNSKKFVAISPTQIHTDCKFVINNIQSVKFQELIDLIENLVLKVCDFYDVDKKLSLSLFLNNCLPTECYTKEDYFDQVDEVEITKENAIWLSGIQSNQNLVTTWFYIPTVTFSVPIDSLNLIKSIFDEDYLWMRVVNDTVNVKTDDIQQWNNIVFLFFIRLAVFNETEALSNNQVDIHSIHKILTIDKNLDITNYVEDLEKYYPTIYESQSVEETANRLFIVNQIMKIINQLSDEHYKSIFKFLAGNNLLNNFSDFYFRFIICNYLFVKFSEGCKKYHLEDFTQNLQKLLVSLNKDNIFDDDIRFNSNDFDKQKLFISDVNRETMLDFPIRIRIDSFNDWTKFVKLLKKNTKYQHLQIKIDPFGSNEITFSQRLKIKKQLKQNNIKIKIVKEKLFD